MGESKQFVEASIFGYLEAIVIHPKWSREWIFADVFETYPANITDAGTSMHSQAPWRE